MERGLATHPSIGPLIDLVCPGAGHRGDVTTRRTTGDGNLIYRDRWRYYYPRWLHAHQPALHLCTSGRVHRDEAHLFLTQEAKTLDVLLVAARGQQAVREAVEQATSGEVRDLRVPVVGYPVPVCVIERIEGDAVALEDADVLDEGGGGGGQGWRRRTQ